MRRRAYMRARGRDKASRKRIWWRSEVSPIPGNGTAKHVYTDRYGHGLVDCSSSFRQWYFSLPRSDRVTLASSRSASLFLSISFLSASQFLSIPVFVGLYAVFCPSLSSGRVRRKLGNCRCNTNRKEEGKGPPLVTRGHHEARRTLRLYLNYMIKSALISYLTRPKFIRSMILVSSSLFNFVSG